MENNNRCAFLIIDDDPINNHICTKYLQLVFPGARVISYTSPLLGIDYLVQAKAGEGKTVLLLDINMPIVNGWDILDRFKTLLEDVRQQFIIYILSSSVAHEDKIKAANIPFVSGFIEKPLSISQLQHLFPEYARKDLDDITSASR